MNEIPIFICIGVILGLILRPKPNYYETCYRSMEYGNYATMGCCGGKVGGNKTTEYLSETCLGCPYLCLESEEK